MVGRAAQGNPWALAQIMGDDEEPSREEVVAELLLFIRETVRELGEQRATGFLKKFYAWYLGRGRFPKPFKQELVMLPTIAEVETRLLAAAPGAARGARADRGGDPARRRGAARLAADLRLRRRLNPTSRRRAGSARSRASRSTTAIPTDQATASQTSFPTGVPRKRPRTAFTMIVNGLFSAKGWSQLGIDVHRDEGRRDERQREEDREAVARSRPRRGRRQADEGEDPREREPEQEQQRDAGDDVADAGLEVEADEEPDARA